MIALVLLLWTAVAAPLTLDEVMSAVDARVPQLAAAEAQIEAAEAKLLASRGAFDPVLAAQTSAYTGKEARNILDGDVSVRSAFGPSLEAGYRRGTGEGEFPTYERGTAENGEVRFGVTVPLLDGLMMGEERVAMMDARLAIDSKTASYADKEQRIRRKAEESWWKWVAAGAKLGVAERQLELAVNRNAALVVEVERGARAPIAQLDNERVLFERRADIARAKQDLAVAAVRLSLWYRDGAGEPVVPTEEQLPLLAAPEATAVDNAQALSRPDVVEARAELERAEVGAAGAGNQLLPKLDGKVMTRQDLTDEPQEWIVGAAVEVPLLLRKGRGTLAAATAAEVAADQAVRALEDQALAELEAARLVRDAAAERLLWASRSEERAEEVLRLERRSWELGASDLFVLLQREEKLAKASKDRIEAEVDLAMADVAVRAAGGAL